jgi:hypothetical protein
MKLIDLTGLRFEKLTVIERYGKRGKSILWRCTCDCGNETYATASNLKRGHVKSCGCLVKEWPKTKFTNKLKQKHPRAYKIWTGIKTRCNNRNRPRYDDYGGRGIKVCDEWQTFEGFWNDMAVGYADNLTLDRIDVNKDYNKENCRWATYTEQANNKRNTILYTYNGETDTLPNLCRKYDKDYRIVRQKIYRDKKDIFTALS